MTSILCLAQHFFSNVRAYWRLATWAWPSGYRLWFMDVELKQYKLGIQVSGLSRTVGFDETLHGKFSRFINSLCQADQTLMWDIYLESCASFLNQIFDQESPSMVWKSYENQVLCWHWWLCVHRCYKVSANPFSKTPIIVLVLWAFIELSFPGCSFENSNG